MKAAVICFTERGKDTANVSARALERMGVEATVAFKMSGKLQQWTAERFEDSDMILFVGATGIAVRAIAPHLKSKTTDPAVLCTDEQGRFMISLVSGHIGGANEWTARLAGEIGAVPVITTATDINGKFAVDVFARKHGLHISDMKLAKAVSAQILEGKKILVTGDFPLEGSWPEELVIRQTTGSADASAALADGVQADGIRQVRLREDKSISDDVKIHIGIYRYDKDRLPDAAAAPVTDADNRKSGGRTLYLVPRVVTLGIGCRRGKSYEELKPFVSRVLKEHRIDPASVQRIASIDVKADEEGIQKLADDFGVPFDTASADELKGCEGEYTASTFVSSQVGVDNVCERSAVFFTKGGELILKKTAENGMTLAAAVREWRIEYE